MSTLYVIATPIGNLEDLTPRAARLLGEVGFIAAEHTVTARRLLTHLGLRRRRLMSYNEHNRDRRIPQILELLTSTDGALVSEAGTPGVSDPGIELVRSARAAGHTVSPVPGPSAVTAALSVAGLPTRSFTFVGFLPAARRAARQVLERLAAEPETLVLFAAPHRLTATLRLLLESLGDRECFVGRELTKLHEEGWSGVLSAALEHFTEPRGEFTLVVAGSAVPPAPPVEPALAEVTRIVAESPSTREALARMQAELGLSRRRSYQLLLQIRRGRG